MLCSPEQAATGQLVADALGVKKTGRDPRVLPVSVVHDPEPTLTLPVAMSVTRDAPTHTVVLTHALAFNAPAAPDAVAALGLGADPARALWDLAGELGAPRSLAELGMAEDGVDALLHRAWAGEPPTA